MFNFVNGCEFCAEITKGSRQKRLPFGLLDSPNLVILDGSSKYSVTELSVIEGSFPKAMLVYSYACKGVDLEDAKVGCGILIRNAITFSKIIVIPEQETERHFGIKISSALDFKTGQYIIPYIDNPVRAQREYERFLKQL